MVSGVWFMPDTKYLRYDKVRGLYTVEFKREALKDALVKYLKNDFANNVKVEHEGQYLDGFVSVEHWIYDEDNKVSPIFKHTLSDLGYEDEQVKLGTVFKTVYIQDEQFWNEEVMTGKVKGFSIGGLFTLEEEKQLGMETFSEVAESVEPIQVVDEVVEPIVEPTQEVVAPQLQRVDEVVDDATQSTSNDTVNDTVNNSNDANLLQLIQNLQQEMLSIKQSLNDKDAKNALLLSELNSIKENQEVVQKENETLKTQVKNSPINKTSYSPSAKVNSNNNSESEGKKLIGGFWV